MAARLPSLMLPSCYLDGALYLEDDASVERYHRAFDHLRASALASRQSMSLVLRLSRDLEREA
ncbi:Scr1 family TA system antitoxin-like transcriptional regulator [Streptomyces xiamenensis]|uniref:Scr1 family TA system antitoxin-like transcriptional regulator n=1 Tax=Streptomyces xiamenensis TaxID=408015 RepID=UPI0036E2F03A